ncbi:recombinase family protein [Ilyobacter polytropus]|uniref:Resolvase domain protein n=1 Tax=Ilyobacter polytropus (strain ATCC 51220 / DSM 2926 / LMG 16218 / CuHBu1) TaxID=572544 RepID=E3HE57_ILYPC|nr:recombinase family protein [Ilyobacter polytropus]ADO84669.1 Resolvase domain protein [Ilyobacter polytropus DSM 2926]
MGRKIGYARVSTVGQNIDAQIKQLENAGCEKIYEEKISGKNIDRTELQKMKKELHKGDTVIVTSFSRLARSTKDLLELVETFQIKGVGFKSLKEDISTQGASGKFILTLLGAVATFERELMLEKQKDGIAYAKSQGKYKGKQRVIYLDDRIKDLFKRVDRKELKAKEALHLSGFSQGTYYKLWKEWKDRSQ